MKIHIFTSIWAVQIGLGGGTRGSNYRAGEKEGRSGESGGGEEYDQHMSESLFQ